MNKLQTIAWIILLSLLAVPHIQAAQHYRVTDLGILSSGGEGSVAYDINDAGQVVGNSHIRAFLWTSEGGMQDVGHLPGGTASDARAINSSGQIVGATVYSFSERRAFLWNNGVMQYLGDLPGGNNDSAAWDVNDSGQVVGESGVPASYHAFLWTSATGMQDLGVLPGAPGAHTYAQRINNSGQVVGWTSNSRAFLWTSDGGMQDLGDLPDGSDFSRARHINDSGHVVGVSNAATGDRAFFWTSAIGMQDLGVLPGLAQSEAWGINNSGDVVGWGFQSSGDQERSYRAFLWTNTDGMQDLNGLLHPADSGWTINQAYAINDAGQIVGRGMSPEGHGHAYLLTPVPEPTTFVMLMFAGAGWRRRRRRAAHGDRHRRSNDAVR